jgi:hypothetical protein
MAYLCKTCAILLLTNEQVSHFGAEALSRLRGEEKSHLATEMNKMDFKVLAEPTAMLDY